LGVVVQEVFQDGVSGYRYREYEFVAVITPLISFGLADEQTNRLGGSIDGEVTGLAADAGFCATEKCVIDTQLPRFNARWRDPQCEDVDCLRMSDAA
jgi:hypothetical protein